VDTDIIANGTHINIKVDDQVVVDYVDAKNTYRKGLRQHNKGCVVEFRARSGNTPRLKNTYTRGTACVSASSGTFTAVTADCPPS
jgi:hypothetical protein